nr:MAG TPA: RVFV ENVELOPE PROTEIN GC fusion envelope glycoprotein bunyavirus [Caudoviricetes sp.]
MIGSFDFLGWVRPVFHWLYTPLLTPRYSHKSAPFLFSLVK